MQKIKRYSWSLFNSYQQCTKKIFFTKVWGIEAIEKEYFEHGAKIHDEVDRYHKRFPYNKALIQRYSDLIPIDYYKQTEFWLEAFIHNPDDKIDKIDTVFVGKLDGIGNNFIADLKTFNNSLSQKVADSMGQVTLYLYMYWVNTGLIPEFRIINFRKDMDSKGEPHKIQIVKTKRTIDDFRKMWSDLKAFDNSIKEGIFYKEPSYLCNDCQFKRVCSAEDR